MATLSNLPCDGDGVCMVCKRKAPEAEAITCKTCATPWHAPCLAAPPETLADVAQWNCPDCSDLSAQAEKSVVPGGDLVERIRAIEADASLTDKEKAKRRQELMSGGGAVDGNEKRKFGGEVDGNEKRNGGGLAILGDKFDCSICMQLLDRPVSTPCGHNFCLKCFEKWVGNQCKKTCAICRKPIPIKMAREPRINSAIVMAIRMAKLSQSNSSVGPPKAYHVIHNQDRPDKAFTTERAKKSGKANACSGKIFVEVPLDHLGPILAENDPIRKLGLLVGDTFEDRFECRQWGAHFPHVSGIHGQADYGAQSVALSGGYVDDEDHGEWFLYTGSGGRDLTGNKRTNKKHSFDQVFKKHNEALRVSCRLGYPVRVVRSAKEKRSSYAPEKGLRYDGIYRIETCWRKTGTDGFKLCRYLFVRCDNEPAPWTSDTQGDRPRSSLPEVAELKCATDMTERKGSPAWDYDEEEGCWMWKKSPPGSRLAKGDYDCDETGMKKRKRKGQESIKQKLLKEFSCLICRKVMVEPLSTPCAHNFCKACLLGAFAGLSYMKERTCGGKRTLRTQKNVMKCPSCKHDISDYLQNPQVNRELMNVIESLEKQMEEEDAEGKAVETGSDEVNKSTDDESSEGSGEDKENCDINAEVDNVKGEDNGNVKASDDLKADGCPKRKTACSVDVKPKRSPKRKKAD